MTESVKKIYSVVIPKDLEGARLDKALATLLPNLSRSRLKTLIEGGMVGAVGKALTDPAAKVASAQKISVTVPPAEEAVPKGEYIPLTVLYEDRDVIVIDKPAGLVVHPAPGHARGTLVNALIHHCGESLSGIGGVKRPGIVHRLDQDTSGVMLAAKNDAAHAHLAKQFAKHTLTRKYLCLVSGVPAPATGRIETLIARHPVNRKKMAVSERKGKEARTAYKLIQSFHWASLVECALETGRTHQVRVHMAHIGHPLIGDPLYSRGRAPKALKGQPQDFAIREFPRQALHAYYLAFTHPATKELLTFQSELPSDMQALVHALKA